MAKSKRRMSQKPNNLKKEENQPIAKEVANSEISTKSYVS